MNLAQLALLLTIAFSFWGSNTTYSQNSSFEPDPNLQLWYDEPASVWTEALPIGNGYMGGMIYGDPNQEHLQLNETTLYSGDPDRTYNTIDIREKYPEVMDLLEAEQYEEAQTLIQDDWLGRAQQCYQPLGDLWIDFQHDEEATDYRRELDLSNAIATTTYKVGKVAYRREYFASYPDRIVVVCLSADQPGSINCSFNFSTPHQPTARYFSEDQQLVMQGKAPGFALRRSFEQVSKAGDQHKYPEIYDRQGELKPNAKTVLYDDEVSGLGMTFDTRIQAVNTGGKIEIDDNKLTVRDADEVTVILSAATSYNGYDKSPAHEGVDPTQKVKEYIAAVEAVSYQELQQRHTKDYQDLFNRVSLQLGNPSRQSRKSTDERLDLFSNGKDPSLAALYFQYGRYLMIAGSRPGGQPLNLQGIWNDKVIPPWASGYTMNINAEMNYWPAELTNLSECHEPFLTAIKELAQNGEVTARNMFGSQGWLANHNMTIWRQSEPVDLCPCSFWPMAAGWLTSHFWERYLFSGDTTFLREEVLPLLEGAVQFYQDWVVPNADGYLITPVGHSPEQNFVYDEDKRSTLSPGPTMDIAIIRESYSRYLEACKLLNIETTLADTVQSQLARLLPYQVGKYGQLQEWQYDFEDGDQEHRHISHLYGFHPGNQINLQSTPDLTSAVMRTM